MTDPIVVDLSLIPQIAVDKVYQDFRVALPTEALAYVRDTSRVQAVPQVQFQLFNRKLVTDPTIPGVPVIHYAGGGYGHWFDLADGDPMVLLCCDGPVSTYYDSGTPTVPGGASGSHTLGSSVASPGGRISSPQQPTPPPNAAGEALIGAADGSAAVVLRRAGGPSPDELGTVVVAAANPLLGVLLGASDATLGVVRLGDGVAPTADMITFMAAVVAFINGIAPGTISPAVAASIAAKVGVASEASEQVASK
jgi:hypothetical protein